MKRISKRTKRNIKCPYCGRILNSIHKRLRSKDEEIAELTRLLEQQIGRVFVASSRRSTFHRPNCVWAEYIMASDNAIEFSSHEEAVEAGYKPCKTCKA